MKDRLYDLLVMFIVVLIIALIAYCGISAIGDPPKTSLYHGMLK